MYHALPARDFLDLSYRDDMCFIINRILRPLAPTEAQEAYALMLDAANSHGCQHWLIDLRRDTTFQPELLTTFFPQPGDQPGKVTYLAYLVSPMLLTELENQDQVPLPVHYDDLPFRVKLFVDELAAQEWLSAN
ncbi:hypothetical protein [Hymenobacter sediminicola]|uniref:STAS/SEC14 domain-containing protein n=1 Tax=Hymenobacter sediminicola TaxID=2761579 RepID=A0A7G7W3V4_9BACT|nr:hypothetical protein [Hymenobacter sediminicola]QNH61047.1 hypothetical protein H4317_12780 [Hymenobacter sediminicola]